MSNDVSQDYDAMINSILQGVNMEDFAIFDKPNYTPFASNPFKCGF